MLRLAFDFIITWRETRTRPNAYKSFIQSGMSFSEVAFAVGFSDPGYFGKAFKKAFNQTLTEYKNNN